MGNALYVIGWLLICAAIASAAYLVFDLGFWITFVLVGISLSVNGIIADWEDRER